MLLLYDLIGLQHFPFHRLATNTGKYRRNATAVPGTRGWRRRGEVNSSGSTSSAVERINSDMVNVSALNPCSIMLWEEWSRRLRLRIIRAHHHDTILLAAAATPAKSFASRLSLINRATNREQAPCLWHSTGKWSRWAVTTPPDHQQHRGPRVRRRPQHPAQKRRGGGGGKGSSIAPDDPRADEDAFVEPPKRAFIQTRSIGKNRYYYINGSGWLPCPPFDPDCENVNAGLMRRPRPSEGSRYSRQ